MTATATETKPRKPSALVETRYDARGLSVTLPKASSVALTKARDVCAALAASAPVLSSKASGIRKALDSLIDDLKAGPIPVPENDNWEERIDESI